MSTRRSGQGEPLVLLHGVGLNHRLWDDLVPLLEPRFEVLRYDLLGHGTAPSLTAPVTPEDFGRQLDQMLDEAGWASAHVLGYSMGGLIAANYAVSRPARVKRLALLNTVYQRSEAEARAVRGRLDSAGRQDARAAAEVSVSRWFTEDFRQARPERVAQIGQGLIDNRRDSFLHAYRMFALGDRLIDAPAITQPVLVMTGMDDVGSTPAMSQALARDLPDSRLCLVAGQRHMLPVEQPQVVAQALTDFMLSTIAEPSTR